MVIFQHQGVKKSKGRSQQDRVLTTKQLTTYLEENNSDRSWIELSKFMFFKRFKHCSTWKGKSSSNSYVYNTDKATDGTSKAKKTKISKYGNILNTTEYPFFKGKEICNSKQLLLAKNLKFIQRNKFLKSDYNWEFIMCDAIKYTKVSIRLFSRL